MNTVVCLKVGTKYGPEYVNRLFVATAKHATKPGPFVCITDDATGIDQCIPIIPALNHEWLKGWWHKVALFGGYKFDAERIVFMDLDTVITGNIDFLFDYNGDFAILRDFYYPAHQFGSAIMSIRRGAHAEIWDRFVQNPLRAMKAGPGDQDWIRSCVDRADLWQDMQPGKIVSYKAHCEGRGLPEDARIVCFHGRPRPHEVNDDWVKENWR